MNNYKKGQTLVIHEYGKSYNVKVTGAYKPPKPKKKTENELLKEQIEDLNRQLRNNADYFEKVQKELKTEKERSYDKGAAIARLENKLYNISNLAGGITHNDGITKLMMVVGKISGIAFTRYEGIDQGPWIGVDLSRPSAADTVTMAMGGGCGGNGRT